MMMLSRLLLRPIIVMMPLRAGICERVLPMRFETLLRICRCCWKSVSVA